ncbi:chaplin family protein [Streptomyces sp. NPDC101150]
MRVRTVLAAAVLAVTAVLAGAGTASACGISVSVVGLLNPVFGNTCTNS